MFVSLSPFKTISFGISILILPSLSRLWFNFIHRGFLVYNICWEDADVDRRILQLNRESSVLTITSAGCNALNYLLDDPKVVHCVDVNPRQNALLELKIAFIKKGDPDVFFAFFGKGRTQAYLSHYRNVRHHLSSSARYYWDTHIRFFSAEENNFFYQSGAGMFARFINRTIDQKGLRQRINVLFNEQDREIRASIFASVKGELFSGLKQILWKTPVLLSLAGIPESQRNAIGDLDNFIKQTLYNVFVEQDPRCNHYWKVYLNGEYSIECCPDYLRPENFETLRARADRIRIFSSGITEYLAGAKTSYSHVILLDHLDWMAEYKPEKISEEFQNLTACTHSGSKLLLRTAYRDLSFVPPQAKQEFLFVKADSDWIASNDKVGTYTGTWTASRS